MEKFQGEISWKCSVHLLDGGSARAGTSRGITAETSRHASSGHAATSSCCLVDLHHDRVDDALELLLLALELIFLSQLVLVKPVKSVLHCLFDFFLVTALELVLQFFLLQGVAHGEAVILEAVLCLDFRFVGLILCLEFFCLPH